MPTSIEALQERLGYRFRDPALLEQALTHRSRAYESARLGRAHYERLEFLGDALLGFLVAERLWAADPAASEGTLTRRRQDVVRAETLAAAALALGLGEALRLGRGEESTGGKTKRSLLADAFEAVLGAVYADGGLRAARRFVRKHLASPPEAEDAKTRLQEWTQARWHVVPRYRIVRVTGPEHARTFTVEALLGDEVVSAGTAGTRKEAEQKAARTALRALEEADAAR